MKKLDKSVFILLGVALGPLVLGYLIASLRMPGIWSWSPSFWGWAFILGWFMLARYLGRDSYRKSALIAGVVPPLLTLTLYIQQFHLTAPSHGLLSSLGQLYPMVAVGPATWVLRILGLTESHSGQVLLLGYALLMGAFVAGLLSSRRRRA